MPTSLTIEGKRLNREKDIVQALNQHFVSVGTKLADQITQKFFFICSFNYYNIKYKGATGSMEIHSNPVAFNN